MPPPVRKGDVAPFPHHIRLYFTPTKELITVVDIKRYQKYQTHYGFGRCERAWREWRETQKRERRERERREMGPALDTQLHPKPAHRHIFQTSVYHLNQSSRDRISAERIGHRSTAKPQKRHTLLRSHVSPEAFFWTVYLSIYSYTATSLT